MVIVSQRRRNIADWLKMLSQMLRFRLARRLCLVVFIAIVLIELIIVFPSYNNYQTSQLDNYRELARIAASVSLTPHDHENQDIQMPEMDRFEATRIICEMDLETRNTPIAAITVNTQQSDRSACIEAGMNDYIAKPIVKKELAAVLQRYFPTTEISTRKPS
ncbi:MAG: response regulator [Gammaproteobacteria bacterium]|nr:response regulator [Gammaproteobacteria bacterium]